MSKKSTRKSALPAAPAAAVVAGQTLTDAHFQTAGAAVNYRDSWRIFRIVTEIVEGYQFLSDLKKEVVILGSARIPPNDKYYKIAVELGRLLGKHGFATITGGGPGIMEAANKGAFENGGTSMGINIRLDRGERVNNYITKSIGFYFPFVRKLIITAPSEAFVFFPGGFGTMDEFFEIVTLIETGKMQKTPVVRVGKEFWNGLFEWLRTVQRDQFHTIHNADLNLIQLVDTVEEAFQIVSRSEERSIF